MLTAVVMLLSVSGTIYAVPQDDQNEVRLCYNSEYGFSVIEREGDEHTTVRTFMRENGLPDAALNDSSINARVALPDEAETKAILAAMGMEEKFIEHLSDESLKDYASAEQIISTVSYIKTNTEGVSTRVTEEEAETAAEGARDMTLPPHEYDGPNGGGGSYGNSVRDTYMKLVFLITYLGQGKYRFSIDATWLTDPTFRNMDSIGAYAQNFTVENNTRSGWYSYDEQSMINSNYSETSRTIIFGGNNFKNATNGSWDGSAAVFQLAIDVSPQTSVGITDFVNCSNHVAHYEYVGKVTQPTQEAYFNTTATYEHSRLFVMPDISIGISLVGPEVSIGLTAVTSKDTRTVGLDSSIHYIPD